MSRDPEAVSEANIAGNEQGRGAALALEGADGKSIAQQAAEVATQHKNLNFRRVFSHALNILVAAERENPSFAGRRLVKLLRMRKSGGKHLIGGKKSASEVTKKLNEQAGDIIYNAMLVEYREGKISEAGRTESKRSHALSDWLREPSRLAPFVRLITVDSELEDQAIAAENRVKARLKREAKRQSRVQAGTSSATAALRRITGTLHSQTEAARQAAVGAADPIDLNLAASDVPLVSHEAVLPISVADAKIVDEKKQEAKQEIALESESRSTYVPIAPEAAPALIQWAKIAGINFKNAAAGVALLTSSNPRGWINKNKPAARMAALNLIARLPLIPNIPMTYLMAAVGVTPLLTSSVRAVRTLLSPAERKQLEVVEMKVNVETVPPVPVPASDPTLSRHGRALDSLALMEGEIIRMMDEKKATQDQLDRFRDDINRLNTRSLAGLTETQLDDIIFTSHTTLRASPARLDSILSTLGRRIGALPPDAKRTAVINGSPEFLVDPLRFHTAMLQARQQDDFKRLSAESQLKQVLTVMADGKRVSPAAFRMAADFYGMGELSESKAFVDIPQTEEELKVEVRDVRGLAGLTVAITAGLAGLGYGIGPSAAVRVAGVGAAAAAGGGAIGTGVAGALGVSTKLAAATGAAIGGLAGAAGQFFQETKIVPPVEPADKITVEQQIGKGAGTLKPKFIVPSVAAFMPTAAESRADQVEFDMFDFIRPTAEGDGHTMAESNIKKAAYQNYQMRHYGGAGFTYAPMFQEPNVNEGSQQWIQPSQQMLRKRMFGSMIPNNKLNLPPMQLDLGDHELTEHDWDPSVALQRVYAPQRDPIVGLDETINESLLYGVVA